MLLDNLAKRKLIQPPDWLPNNTMYLTVMGSHAYGVANYESGDLSDFDVYGWCFPPKYLTFPHLSGEILGFGRQTKRFDQYQQHNVLDKDALGGKGRVYDLSVYGIVRYFQLLMENNPNILDSIFTPDDCVLHTTAISNLVRENRTIFVHKGCFHKLKSYAFSQLKKCETKDPIGKRKEIREKFGGEDVKFLYHCVRLVDECEQLLIHGEMDLRRNREHLKAVRRGDVKLAEVKKWFAEKEIHLEKLYNESKLPWGPDEAKIKQLLLTCLESHYGSLDKAIVVPGKNDELLRQIRELVNQANL